MQYMPRYYNISYISCVSYYHVVMRSSKLIWEFIHIISFAGLCHERCTVSSTVDATNSCKQCSQNRALSQAKCSDESPKSPLLLQGKYFPKPISANKGVNVGNFNRPSASIATLKHSSAMKHGNSSNSTAKTKRNLGVIWKKKSEDTGTEFRLRNILLKGNPDRDSLIPTCHLCRRTYDPDLMYIRCETCSSKFVPGRNSFYPVNHEYMLHYFLGLEQ